MYPAGARGDARPETVITKGINGPGSVVFDPAGDLWVANTTGTIVEYSKAALPEASLAPAVILSYQVSLGSSSTRQETCGPVLIRW